MDKSKNKVIILISIVVIIAGIVMAVVKGFNFDLKYQDAKRIELNIGKEFERDDIKAIAKETLGDQPVIIQKIEIYEDAVSVLAKDINEEQRTNFVTKINEKYGLELDAEQTEIITVPHTHLRDLINPYIIPFIIATVIILVYIAARYHKLKIIKTIVKTAFIVILAQLLLFSIISITRIPVGRLTIPMVLTIYVLSLVYCTNKYEKELKEQNADINT